MNTLNVNDDVVADVLSEAPKRRTRQFKGRVDMPDIPPEEIEAAIDGKPALRVGLFGTNIEDLPEEDRFMLLDAEDWPQIKAISPWWTLASGKGGQFVARGGADMGRLARQSSDSNPNVSLARLIMGANKTQRVVCNNPLDLRKASLALVDSRAEVGAVYRTVAEFAANLNRD